MGEEFKTLAKEAISEMKELRAVVQLLGEDTLALNYEIGELIATRTLRLQGLINLS